MSWIFSAAMIQAYENSHCSQARAEESLGGHCSAGEPYAQLNVMATPHKFWHNDKTMEFSRLSQFGLTCAILTEGHGEELLMSFRAAFPARTLVSQVKELELQGRAADSGKKWQGLLAKFDPVTYSWKTAQGSLLADLEQSLETWPRSGSMRNGECYQQPMLARRISESESGFLPNNETFFHTPNTTGMDGGSNSRKALKKRTLQFPTPTAHNAKEHNSPSESTRNAPTLATHAGGILNPMWVEGLMGWPKDWTCLNPISHVWYLPWLMGGTNDKETRAREAMRILRIGHVAEEVSGSIGRLVSIPEAAILLSELCEHANRPNEARIFMACEEALEEEMRGVRIQQGIASTSSGSKHQEQREGEHSDALQALSRLLAYYGQEAWKDGSWENGIPRVATRVASRVDRLKAIGNGQVPLVAATAFKLLLRRIKQNEH